MIKRGISCFSGLMFLIISSALILNAATRNDAQNMVNQAVALWKANGKDAAIKEFNKKEGVFIKGEMYIFVINKKGDVFAHVNQGLVGKNVINLKDPDGVHFIKKMIEATSSSQTAWMSYKWTNPSTKKIQSKMTYCYRMGDFIISSGVYE
jgi:signal transduction histidine kinase